MKKKILIVKSARHASTYYRLVQPANILLEMGHSVRETQCIDEKGIDWSVIERDYDIAIFQFGFLYNVINLIKRFKKLGVLTILETDDDYYHIPAGNKAFWQLHPRVICYKVMYPDKPIQEVYAEHNYHVNHFMDNFKWAASNVDILQVSTRELAQYYSALSDNIVVLENCIDNSLYDKVEKKEHDGVIVGWFGSATHLMDIRFLVGAIPDNVTFLTYGHSDLDKVVFAGNKNVVSKGYFDLGDLPKILSQMDFGVVPLEDNKFNDGKSDLKGLEFAAMGLPVIASPVAPYRRFIRHMKNGILLKNNNGKNWLKAINLLTKDKDLRIKLGKEAKKDAIKRDIRKNIHKWVKAYGLE